jgi:hypothetical protein
MWPFNRGWPLNGGPLNRGSTVVFTCKPHLNHTYSLYIITLPIFSCISAVEKDRDSIFTIVTTLRKPGFGQKWCSVNWPSTDDATSKNVSYTLDNS